ncbi:MAG: hypothetical protein HPY55_07170 [Firmicutes bacterium]|nr:hypothetical protein [Bacillota bacterium]
MGLVYDEDGLFALVLVGIEEGVVELAAGIPLVKRGCDTELSQDFSIEAPWFKSGIGDVMDSILAIANKKRR